LSLLVIFADWGFSGVHTCILWEWYLLYISVCSIGRVGSGHTPDSDALSDSEDSWVIAPPSCLTREDPVSEIGSLENLLIEHPSMSVYHHRESSNVEEGTSFLEERPQNPVSRIPSNQQLVCRQVSHGRLWRTPTVTQRLSTQDKIKETTARVPKLTRKALKRHNKHKNNRQANRSKQQWHVFQPRRH
jgi:hypothetical protein